MDLNLRSSYINFNVTIYIYPNAFGTWPGLSVIENENWMRQQSISGDCGEPNKSNFDKLVTLSSRFLMPLPFRKLYRSQYYESGMRLWSAITKESGWGSRVGWNPTQVYFLNVLPLCNARCNLIDEKELFPWQHQWSKKVERERC